MNTYNITFTQERISVDVAEGTTLLEAEIAAGLSPDAPCGGQGTCAKCKVKILTGDITGIHKACCLTIHSNMTVDTSLKSTGHTLLTKGASRKISVAPMIQSVNITVDKCLPGESLSDWERLKQAVSQAANIPKEDIPVNLNAVSSLYDILLRNKYQVNVMLCDNEILLVRAAEVPYYLIAFDIGTTSIVGYLLNGQTGEEMAVSSMLNPQSQYGADVILRSNYAQNGHEQDLSRTVRKAMHQIIGNLCETAAISREDIFQISFVGNTCMHHLFLQITTGSLVHSPYNPAVSEPLLLCANDYGLDIHPQGRLMMLPNIAGFVGADTMGCLLATDFDTKSSITLMIDIGTNGELVLGNKERMITCSTAAGPAFEGAKIACGMRGALGAIDHLSFEGDALTFTTIGGKSPCGICGSGLMDLIALLLSYGFLDSSGRLLSVEELTNPVAKTNAWRVITVDGKRAFLLVAAKDTLQGKDIYLTQKDVREVQLAKGAIAAGISLLCQKLSIETKDIEEVLIAGAFGNYMSPKSACAIGLIPPALLHRITPIGNAAGEGAKIAVLNQKEFEHTKALAERIEFLELATEPDFQDCFVDELEFPELNT